MLTLISGLFYAAYYTDIYNDVIVDSKILTSIKVDNTYYYLYEPNESGDSFKSLKSNKPLNFKNNIYSHKESTEAFDVIAVLAWILTIVFAIFMIMSWVEDREDLHWEFKRCCQIAFGILITCDLEEGYYYYTALGRLVAKSQHTMTYYYEHRKFGANSFPTLLNCPRFKTKKQRRNEVLNKLV